MSRKSFALIAGVVAFSTIGAASAMNFPSSPNESGPAVQQHVATGSAVGATADRASLGTGGYQQRGTYEVQTPSSPNESAPWLLKQPTPLAVRRGTSSDRAGSDKVTFRHPKTGDLLTVTRARDSDGDFVGTAAVQPRSRSAPRLHP